MEYFQKLMIIGQIINIIALTLSLFIGAVTYAFITANIERTEKEKSRWIPFIMA